MKGIMMTGFFQNFSDAFYKAVIKDQRYLAYLDGLKITILISILCDSDRNCDRTFSGSSKSKCCTEKRALDF